MHQEVGDGLRFGLSRIISNGARVERGCVHVKAAAGVNHVADEESDDKRECGYDFEVEKSLAADAADLAQILHAGDSGDHGAEDHHRDDHGDQADEGIAQRLHRDAAHGPEVAEEHRQPNADCYLHPQRFVEAPSARDGRVGLGRCRHFLFLIRSSFVFAGARFARGADEGVRPYMSSTGLGGFSPATG